LGAAALARRPSMNEVAKWVFNMSMPDAENPQARCVPVEILDEAIEDPATEAAALGAIQHLHAIWNKPDPKIIAAVYATAQTVCDPWLDPNVTAATDLDGDGEWVDLDWLMDTGPNGDRANTLYLLVSLDDYQRLSPVLAGLLSDLKSQAYEWEMTGRRLPAPLLMLIDEAGNMPLDWLPEVSSTCAGIGIQLVTIWQSYAQINETYGKRADTLLTNHATKLFFPGSSDESTLGYVSKIVGDEQVERRSWSNDIGNGGRRSVSGQSNVEALVPYFLSRLPLYGSALMIHSNTPPAHVRGRPWWKIRRLAAMVPSPPSTDVAQRSGPWTPTPDCARPVALAETSLHVEGEVA
ncbi:MAG: TraM recognition domain-containing protein, partial [Actinomycetota bacterium]